VIPQVPAVLARESPPARSLRDQYPRRMQRIGTLHGTPAADVEQGP